MGGMFSVCIPSLRGPGRSQVTSFEGEDTRGQAETQRADVTVWNQKGTSWRVSDSVVMRSEPVSVMTWVSSHRR